MESKRTDDLERLSRLLDKGEISEAEYRVLARRYIKGRYLPQGSKALPGPPSPEPGWYPDPEGGSGERFWNGWWTENYRESPYEAESEDGHETDDVEVSVSGFRQLLPLLVFVAVVGGGFWLADYFGLEIGLDFGQQESGDLSGAFVACRGFVRDALVAPATADFHGFASDETVYLGDGRYRTDSSVDSANGFGAFVRTDYTCFVREQGGDWVLESLTYD